MFAGFNPNDIMDVFFRQHLPIVDRLDRGMIMVLVNLSIDSRRCLLMAVFNDLLVHDCGCYFFVNGGVMVSGLVPTNNKRQ